MRYHEEKIELLVVQTIRGLLCILAIAVMFSMIHDTLSPRAHKECVRKDAFEAEIFLLRTAIQQVANGENKESIAGSAISSKKFGDQPLAKDPSDFRDQP